MLIALLILFAAILIIARVLRDKDPEKYEKTMMKVEIVMAIGILIVTALMFFL